MSDQNRVVFISVESWGEEGELIVANGHHDPAAFIEAAIAVSRRQIGEDEATETEIREAKVTHGFATYRIPADPARLGEYRDDPWSSEQVEFHCCDESEPGSWAVTYARVI